MKSAVNERKVRKIPERRCVGCGQSFPKPELIRVVRGADGTVSLDFTGKKSGRGAYICKKIKCFRAAKKSKRLESNLECLIPDDVYDRLENEFFDNENGK